MTVNDLKTNLNLCVVDAEVEAARGGAMSRCVTTETFFIQIMVTTRMRTTRMVLKLNLVPLSLTLLRPLPLSGTVRPEFLMIVLNLMAKNRRDLSLARQELTLQLEGLVSARPAPLLISPPMGLSALLPPQPHFPAHQPGCQSFKKFRSLSFIFRKKL